MALADALVELQELTERLRQECPWDREQTAKTQPLDKTLTTQIRAQLLKTKKDAAMNTWVKDLEKSYEDKVDYAAGFAPPPTSSGSTASK